MKNRSTGNMEIDGIIRPDFVRSLRDGILSESQHDDYIEIIKAVKWALNFIALLMTFISAMLFARTKTASGSTTFIVALNVFGFLSALFSIVGYTLNFALDGTSKVLVIYTLYMNMYTGAVCRRVVYMMNMLMSVQRLTVIALPFIARTKFRSKIHLAVTIICVVVTVFATHVYIPISYTVVGIDGVRFRLRQSALYERNVDGFEMTASATKFMFAFLPLMASLLANILLLAYLKNHARKSENLCAAQKPDQTFGRRNQQVTLTVLVSSVSFTLLSFPANIHLLVTTYTTVYGYHQREHYLFMVVHEALLGLLTLGDISNFLSYVILSSAFRNQLSEGFQYLRCIGVRCPVSTGVSTSSTSFS